MGEDLLACLGANPPILWVRLVDRGRPGHHLAVDGREHQHPFCALCGYRQQDPLERLARRRLEDQELALARIDLERLVAGESRHAAGTEPRAVDDEPGDQGPPPAWGQHDPAPISDPAIDPKAGVKLGAVALGGSRELERERDGVGDRLAGDLELPSSPRLHLDPVPEARSVRWGDRDLVAFSPTGLISAPQRSTGSPSASRTESRNSAARRISSARALPGSSRSRCEGFPELVPLVGQAGLGFRLQQPH